MVQGGIGLSVSRTGSLQPKAAGTELNDLVRGKASCLCPDKVTLREICEATKLPEEESRRQVLCHSC